MWSEDNQNGWFTSSLHSVDVTNIVGGSLMIRFRGSASKNSENGCVDMIEVFTW